MGEHPSAGKHCAPTATTEADLAGELGVDAKTGAALGNPGPARRTGPPRTRSRKLLDVPQTWLWPGLDEESANEARRGSCRLPTRTGPTHPKRLWL